MKEITPSYLSRLTCILIILIFQFPVVSLAFELRIEPASNRNFSPIVFREDFSPLNISPVTVFPNGDPISIADRNNNTIGGSLGLSTPYPSTILVSALSGTVSDVNVTINGFSSGRPRDINIALVAPTGQAFILMGDVADLNSTTASPVNITIDDEAGIDLPLSAALSSTSYRPRNYAQGSPDRDDFPGGPSSVNSPAPEGGSTLSSIFDGLNPNGTWSLYITDDSQGNTPSGSLSNITGGWSIDITTAGGVTPTNTTVNSNLNPALTSQTITFTSTTTEVGGANPPVTTGTVTFTQNGSPISAGCTNVAVNVTGNATCMTTLPEGTRTITATYSGTATLGTSNGNLSPSQVVNSPTIVSGGQFCNNGGISIPDSPAVPVIYPSNISVTGLVGNINKVTVQLNGLTTQRTSNLDLLLVGPGNQAFQFMSDIGDTSTAVSGINLTLDDAAASQLPFGPPLTTGGSYRPADADTLTADPYPAPAPGSFNRAAPTGMATFASVYGTGSIQPNGNWRLFAIDDGAGGTSSTLSGWCVNFTLNKFSTASAVGSSQNPSNAGQSVTFTATVTTTGTGTPTGTVQFFDGMTSLGTGMLNGSGQASLTTSALSVGAHNITAQYQGANVGAGGGGYAASTSMGINQTVNAPSAANVGISGRILSASGRGISKALVIMTDSGGNTIYALSNPFGYYRFSNVRAGETYVVTVSSKNRRFAPQVVTVDEDLTEFNFTEQIE